MLAKTEHALNAFILDTVSYTQQRAESLRYRFVALRSIMQKSRSRKEADYNQEKRKLLGPLAYERFLFIPYPCGDGSELYLLSTGTKQKGWLV